MSGIDTESFSDQAYTRHTPVRSHVAMQDRNRIVRGSNSRLHRAHKLPYWTSKFERVRRITRRVLASPSVNATTAFAGLVDESCMEGQPCFAIPSVNSGPCQKDGRG